MSIYQDEDYTEAKEKLKNEYALEYEKCEAYIHSMRTNARIEESCLQQILDDFLSAQADDRELNIVTGSDLRSFCDKIFRAETERIWNRNINFIQWLFVLPISISLIIFIRSFLYTRPGHFLDNANHLFIKGYELYYFLIFITGLTLKKLISILFFHHSRLVRKVETAVYVFIIVITSFIAVRLSILFPIAIPISFPVYIIMTLLTLTLFIACWVFYRKTNPVAIR